MCFDKSQTGLHWICAWFPGKSLGKLGGMPQLSQSVALRYPLLYGLLYGWEYQMFQTPSHGARNRAAL